MSWFVFKLFLKVLSDSHGWWNNDSRSEVSSVKMVNDILINTETDLNRWTAIHRLFMTHKTPMPIFFVHHLFTIYWRYVHTVSPEGRIIKYFLSIFLFSSHQSVFFKGKRRSYILVFTRTTTHKTYKLYMLVTVIQHLMAIIKSIFLLFFFFPSMRPCIDH